jgi:ABC-type branched-subunit amino acid transport system substrate-binding protein
MKAAINRVNQAGGICGRQLTIETINDGWNGPQGQADIQAWCQSGKVFALVGEPDSEGLKAALESGSIDRCNLPAVGTDGMLADQYWSPLVWPVAASTVTNMHIIASYAVNQLHAKSFGIIYDTAYHFGAEGANAFGQELRRLGKDIVGFGGSGCSGRTAYCGVSSQSTDYSSQIQAFNSACSPCDVVVLLLEPGPAENWMSGESGNWYVHLEGGEPLFDYQVGENCAGCGQAKMQVWTGYHPAIQPFDAEKAVYTYCQALKAVRPADDCQNEFTEGAYLGAQMFITAAQTLAQQGLPLTRGNLKQVLDQQTFDLGLSQPLHYGGDLPHLANISMAAFSENYSGSFNGWNYDGTGFLPDPAPGQDLPKG